MTDYQTTIEYHRLTTEILSISNIPVPRVDYFYSILQKIKTYTNCDNIELWLNETSGFFVYKLNESNKFDKKIITSCHKKSLPDLEQNSFLNLIRLKLFKGMIDSKIPFFTTNGSFWYSGLNKAKHKIEKYKRILYNLEKIDIKYESLSLIPISIQKEVIGFLEINSNQKKYLDANKINLFEGIAHTLSIAIINKRAQGALRERIKELTCLYDISKVAEKEELPLKEVLQSIVNLIPAAWQFPEITVGQISFDGGKNTSLVKFKEIHSQQVNISIKGVKRGFVKAIYTEKKPELDEGPFLKEERNLINAIAKQVGLIVERRETEEEKSNLQEQIRHADRLATIGQLAAGVAHELNEPLSNILGFAQLTQKHSELSRDVKNDIDKIINASLHAREIIKKLMLFSRQMPPKRGRINMNSLVEESLYFFEARCAKSGINLIRNLEPKIPEIDGDSGLLNQVLVNLVVNSIQAMPEGGNLIINTTFDKDYVYLIVEDSGTGINDEIKSKIFIPFFTTKDVNEGTGLGLAVVHGIVLSHKGSIEFESELGKGTAFKTKFPLI